MNRLLPLLAFTISFLTLTAQQGMWREGEMEVRVYYSGTEQLRALHGLNFRGDIYRDGSALLYVTKPELSEIERSGLDYDIRIGNLNEYSREFWNSRDEYHSYEEIIQVMNMLSLTHSAICKKYNYGFSVQGRELAALKISDNVAVDENEPEVGFDGGIHGDEIGGSENLIRFAEFLCNGYGSNPEVTQLINSREIWLYVMVNPDGRVNMTRENFNGVDLNRDWGYMWDEWGGSPFPYSQVETRGMRNWFYDNQFVVHTSYHSGTEELVYPWSYRPDPTPDDAQIDQLASVYVTSSGYSNLEYGQGYDGLYPINGSSKDTYYGMIGSIGWTMEISYDKQPPASQIMFYYNANEPAMLAMIKYAGYGLRGVVTDAETGEPIPGIILVNDYFPAYADPEKGDYHKYILEGSYTVTALAIGYEPQTKYNINVPNLSVATCDFDLVPNNEFYAYRITTCQIPDNNFNDEGNTPAVLGAPDNVNYSIGKDGWIVVDMFRPVLDGPGQEIRIYEGDDTPENYTCYAGPSVDGPWTLLGQGPGTKSFDFSNHNVEEARFIKLIDDGDGQANVDNAGFDLDALEALSQPPVIDFRVDVDINDPSGNNNHRLDPGETVSLVIKLRNHGGLTANMVRGNLNYDSTWVTVQNPDLYFGSIAHAEIAQATVMMTVNQETPVEELVMTVLNVTANNGTYNNSFPGHYTVGAMIEDWESGSFSHFDWNFTDVPWVLSPIFPYEGLYSAKSGNINDSGKSGLTISMEVTGYDDISFYRKVSSEEGFDFLRFYIDGVLMQQWSGLVDWEFVNFDVTPGFHEFKWRFEKDDATSHGYDCGWIDWVQLPSYNVDGNLKAIANASPHKFCGPGESELGIYATGGSGNYSYSWSPDYNISSTTYQFPTATPDTTTIYTVEVDDGNDMISPEIKVSIFPIPETPVVEQQGDSLISSADYGNQWFRSSGPIFGATGKVYYPQTQDTYYVIVKNEYGCKSDTSNKVDFLFTGLEEPTLGSIMKIYPNPARDAFTIYIEEEGPWDVKIFDMTGRLVESVQVTGNQHQLIHLDSFPEGICLIKLSNGRELFVKKLVIAK